MISDLWKILETVATMTKEVERANAEIKDVRKDLNTLTIAVTELKNKFDHHRSQTDLILDRHKGDIDHEKERNAAQFDVLITRLDSKISDLERRLPSTPREGKSRRALKGADDG